MSTPFAPPPDRYRLEGELGRGGMATVYLADDLKHGRKVAIKVMHPELAAAIGQDRFLREIAVAARLSHPHILPLFDSGAVNGQLYYVMPYVSGDTLRGRLAREKQLSLEDALRLTREIASALGHAHHHGLVHRDVKPENVLLSDGIALVADFGIARVLSTDPDATATRRPMTTLGSSVGTPLYMAPEQAMGNADVDARADLYALGCTLYEMLAGQPPFTGASIQAVVSRHLHDPVPPLSSVRAGIPDGIVRVIEKVLSKSPADRFPTMARFAEALAVAGAGPTAPTPEPDAVARAIANNLPKQRTHFIGRERELAECARLLGDTRLLTLTGVGGCGKTRLALRLAQQMLESYPDGVWFVDLAPLLEPERVPLAVARAIGVQEVIGTPLIETIAKQFATQRSLLLLDNCEHLMEAVTALADRLLAGSEALTLLATSREGLGVEGERLMALRSLSVPSRMDEVDPRAVEASEAVRLFVDRAQGVDPKFELDAHRAPIVAEICRRLDGIPLAIELAAARVKMLSVDDIRNRLDDRFRLLTGGSRTALPRHQTLRGAIEWSYDHLSAEEQRLLRLLAVFAGGWTLSAAAAVAGNDADEFEILEILGRLVDKSLVNVDRLSDGATRYSMLETVRQFAREKLRDAGEGDEARSRHLGYFVALAEELPADVMGPQREEWLFRFVAEQENVLAALEWCDREETGGEKGLRLAATAVIAFEHQGQMELASRLAREALTRPGADRRTALRARVLRLAGIVAYRRASYREAGALFEEALEFHRAAGDRLGIARVLHWDSHVVALEDAVRAREMKLETLTLSREIGDPAMLAVALNAVAEMERFEGHLDAAEPLYEEAIALFRAMSNERVVAVFSCNLAAVDIATGRLDTARRRLVEVTAIAERLELKGFITQAQLDLTSVLACASGDVRAGARLAGAAQQSLVAMGAEREPADEKFVRPWVDRMRDALGAMTFEECFAAGRALPADAAIVEGRAWLAARPSRPEGA